MNQTGAPAIDSEAIHAAIEAAAAPERPVFRRRLKGLERRAHKGQPHERGIERLRRDIDRSERRRTARIELRPSGSDWPEYPAELPVSVARERLLAAIEAHQVLVVCGDTGSGKTTQLPKMCLELGRGIEGVIGHTQPRRIAARTVSARIASELGGEVGGLVGYRVRFTDEVQAGTAVKLMTDGVLLNEIRTDPELTAYDTILIDEAHERSLNIDFLLGYLKRLLPRRPDLKLIITSATIDPERFSRHFDDAPILDVEGRTHPVELRYRPLAESDSDTHERDREQAVIEAVSECSREGPGDILVFLPSERAIRDTEQALSKAGLRDLKLLPLFGRLASGDQQKVFARGGGAGRRVVLATNVAETSLTVPGIRYVIDSGEARISRYSVRTKMQRLPIEPIAQASADQRKGRCGREGPGICIRLYSEEDYERRPRYTDPEVLRTNLASVVLQMASLGLGKVEDFPFIDPPERRLINDGYTVLFELGAVDGQRQLTELGRRLARIPVDPRLARIVLAGADEDALEEAIVLAAALAIQDPRERPQDARAAADQAHAVFRDPRSDFQSLLNLWAFWREQRAQQSQSRLRQIAREHFLSFVRMREWLDLYGQFRAQARELGMNLRTPREVADAEPAPFENVHRAVLTGLLGNIARHEGEGEFQSTRNRKLRVFPGSGVAAKKPPKWIVAAEISETSRVFARTVAAIEREWIERLASHLLNRSYRNPRWQAKAQRVAADEQSTLYGLVINPRRRVNYGPIAPAEARTLFVRDALAGGELATDAGFVQHNRALLEELSALEDRARRRDIVADESVLVDFYDARIPAQVYDGPTFEAWRKQAGAAELEALQLTREALMQRDADEVSGEAYPEVLEIAGLKLPLAYHFAPGAEDDGVTLTVPRAAIRQIPPGRPDWLVPGLRAEKIEGLLRALPKHWRRRFVPVPDFARALIERLEPSDRPLTEAMAEELRRMTGDAPPAGAWAPEALEPHLHLRLRVIDDAGETVDCGRDLEALAERHGDAAARELETGEAGFERDDVSDWDFGALPESVEIERHGIVMQVHPALSPVGNRLALTVFATTDEAAPAHRAGVRALIRRRLGSRVRELERRLAGLDRTALQFSARIGGKAFVADFIDAVTERAFLAGTETPREREPFEACFDAGRERMWDTAEALLAEIDALGARYRAVHRRIEGSLPMTWIEAARDVAEQLDHLIFPGFITATPDEWLAEYPRYLEAVARRLDVLDREPERDRRGRAEVEPLWNRAKQVLPPPERIAWAEPAQQELRWMIEELRVSLFAQHLGTRRSVSPGKVEKQIATVA
ncbi:MAG: ATP-dependent RNA helicase HrpA [Halofilum sp. (in: g-proteobacteria)]